MNQSKTVLEVRDLKTYFHTASGIVKAVDGVSFDLHANEILGIVGESGSGKSVTAYSLIDLLPGTGRIESGSIYFHGQDILANQSQPLKQLRGRDITMIFQDPMTSLDPVFKVGYQMVEQICTHDKSVSREQALERSIEMLRQVGIKEPEAVVNVYPFELSGGMCQRVVIAMALSMNPDVIIADEPTTALDVTVQSQVLDLLKQVRDEYATAMVLITHNLGVIWEMADYVLVFYAGRIVEQADTKTLYKNALHPYTWGLFDSIPKMTSTPKEPFDTIAGMPPDLRLTGEACAFASRCPYALDECWQAVPPLIELTPGHSVACFRQQSLSEGLERGGEHE